MRIKTSRNKNTLELTGKLNAENAPQLETVIDSIIDNAKSLVIDMKNLEYISSAGLNEIIESLVVLVSPTTSLNNIALKLFIYSISV